jgi:hypothetical protein
MKIVSSFHDYYDGVQATDMDRTPLYLRTYAQYPREERAKTYTAVALRIPSIPGNLDGRWSATQPNVGCLAFCGKRYPFWMVGETHCYSLAQVTTATRKEIQELKGEDDLQPWQRDYLKKLKKRLDLLAETHHEPPNKYSADWGTLNVGTWEAWQEHMKSHTIMKDDIFLHEKAPVIAVYSDWVEINPNLRKMGFQAVMDPYTAYQELSMFLGNNMAQQLDPIPKTTDELKAHAHGYDKWSFRTHKEDSKKFKKRKAKKEAKKEEVTLDDSDFKL